METVDTNEILELYQYHGQSLLIDMIPILCGCHISFCYFFALRVARGILFKGLQKLCVVIFNIFAHVVPKI